MGWYYTNPYFEPFFSGGGFQPITVEPWCGWVRQFWCAFPQIEQWCGTRGPLGFFSRALFFLIRSLFSKCFSIIPGFGGCSSGGFVSVRAFKPTICHVPSLFSSILTSASIIIFQSRWVVLMFWSLTKWISTFCQDYILVAEIRVLIIPDWDSNHSKFTEWTNHSIVSHRQSSQRITFDSTPATIISSDFSGLLCVGHNKSGELSRGLWTCLLTSAIVLYLSISRGTLSHRGQTPSCLKCHFLRRPEHSHIHIL